jgi:hypothetical protein
MCIIIEANTLMSGCFINECAQEGLIEVNFIRTEEQLGDALTKPLSRVKFAGMCARIGLRESK